MYLINCNSIRLYEGIGIMDYWSLKAVLSIINYLFYAISNQLFENRTRVMLYRVLTVAVQPYLYRTSPRMFLEKIYTHISSISERWWTSRSFILAKEGKFVNIIYDWGANSIKWKNFRIISASNPTIFSQCLMPYYSNEKCESFFHFLGYRPENMYTPLSEYYPC